MYTVVGYYSVDKKNELKKLAGKHIELVVLIQMKATEKRQTSYS